jgi:hypothetical protein
MCAVRRGMWRPRHTLSWRAPDSPPWSGWRAWTPSMRTGSILLPQVLVAMHDQGLVQQTVLNLWVVAEHAWPIQLRQAAALVCLRCSCMSVGAAEQYRSGCRLRLENFAYFEEACRGMARRVRVVAFFRFEPGDVKH